MIFNNQQLVYHSNPSKSYLHRYLILSSFIEDKFEINNISLNNDILETINVLKKLGKEINVFENKIVIFGSKGIDLKGEIFINESGSTLRMLLPLLSYFSVDKIKVGDKLIKRPILLYKPFIREIKDNFIYLKKGDINEIDGSVSSQFISGLLIYNAITNNYKKMIVKNEIVSKNYIDITFDVLNNYGFIFNDFTFIKKEKHQNFIYIENDFSSAAFYIVYGLLKDGIIIDDLNINSLQGDRIILDIFKDDIVLKDNLIEVNKSKRKGIKVDLENCIDLGPILFTYAAFCKEESIFYNFNRLKDKESNRLEAMLYNFDLLNVNYKLEGNVLKIKGIDSYSFVKAKSFFDHRIAMSLIVFGLVNEFGIDIDNIDCIKKSNLYFLEEF